MHLTLVACAQEEKLWVAVKMSAIVLGSALLIFTALMNSVSW